ncbi:hypothetical protein [Tomitella gaofuii]|uniref:hypothetical protein n=1 Tax=Tomitella gaofuii TaxID=2760083 RepID=UPI0015F97579|nr:hypothetical protein [Tomitella gaofuii]
MAATSRRGAAQPPGPESTPGRAAAALRAQARPLLCLAAAVLLWCVGFACAGGPLSMGGLGLLNLFDIATTTGLALLLLGTLASIFARRPGWVTGTHIVTYLALVHGTPAVLYGTVRYAWSYKHLGIVDYILRNGAVDPHIGVNPIYHNWSGFFAGSALVSSAGGVHDAFTLALWAPLGFNLMILVVLRFVLRGLTDREDLAWLAVLWFFVITWVGQDYFSPQAMAFVLYLAVIGTLLRRDMPAAVRLGLFTVTVAALAVTHQITLLVLVSSVTALVMFRVVRGWYLPLIAIVLCGGWALTFARGYTVANVSELIAGFGRPVANADATFAKSAGASGAEALVSWGDRSTVALAVLIALIGAWLARRRGHPQRAALVLMAAPVATMVQTSFGGEALLRVYLFAAPFIAYLAAMACLPPARASVEAGAGGSGGIHRRSGPPGSAVPGFPYRRFVAAAAAVALVVPGFFLGYYGKERGNYFTQDEVAASAWVDRTAPPGSLLVTGSTNYPGQFLYYDKFAYVAIDREPGPSRENVVTHPVGVLHDWLTNPQFARSYLLITRSQEIGSEMGRTLPPGTLADVERELRRSPQFTVVYENPDAVVFAPSQAGEGS